jgi:predicted DNA-binding ribbon-helix-helix protein
MTGADKSTAVSDGSDGMTVVLKHSIIVAGRKTSISLEDAFWKGLREIASAKEMTLSALVASIAQNRQHGNLSSCIRLFVLEYYQTLAATSDAIENTSSSKGAFHDERQDAAL